MVRGKWTKLAFVVAITLMSSWIYGQDSTDYEAAGFVLEYGSKKVDKDGTHLLDVTIPLPGMFQAEGDFKFKELVFGDDGSLKKNAEGSAPISFRSVNNFKIVAKKYTISSGVLKIDGVFRFPERLGSVEVPFQNGRLEADGAFLLDLVSAKIKLPIFSGTVEAKTLQIDRQFVTVTKASVSYSYLKDPIPLPNMSFYGTGDIAKVNGIEWSTGSTVECSVKFKFAGATIDATELILDDQLGKITLRGEITGKDGSKTEGSAELTGSKVNF